MSIILNATCISTVNRHTPTIITGVPAGHSGNMYVLLRLQDLAVIAP